jgi:uncharacterized membrane-anchored protein
MNTSLMMRFAVFFLLFCCFAFSLTAQDESDFDSLSQVEDSVDFDAIFEAAYLHFVDSVENSLNWQHGVVVLGDDLATLTVPKGYKYLDIPSSHTVLEELWGNPEGSTLGMLFKEDESAMSDVFSYAVNITFEEEGWIDDDEADDLDYDDMMEQMQNDQAEENRMREELGYGTMDLLGWAAEPFYDEENRVLHWALDLHVEGAEVNTLNYNIRKLGRHGYLTLNAIGDMGALPVFEREIDNVLYCADFNDGSRYEDFDPDIDKVAALGIGGLIAGKVLLKTGFIALIVKAWKFIAIGALALFAGLRAYFRRRKPAAIAERAADDEKIQ